MEKDHFGDTLFLAAFFLIIGFVYIIPTFIAFRRNHPNRWPILLINVVFGGTILGWGIALGWALRAVHRPGSTSSGGESGLNIFVNDVRRVQLVEPPPHPQPSTTEELERLHELLVRGAISQDEFDGLKAKLLDITSSRESRQ
jgi:Superinfection immunity protein/Short C-terminal domain